MRQLDPGRVSCVKRDEDRRDYKVAFGKLRWASSRVGACPPGSARSPARRVGASRGPLAAVPPQHSLIELFCFPHEGR
jgi:hypothetical protein